MRCRIFQCAFRRCQYHRLEGVAHTTSFAGGQVAEKVEVQEALPPAGGLGAKPLSLMPQHFPREPAKRCFQATAAIRFFSTV